MPELSQLSAQAMIVTIINRDKRFPLATLGIYYLLPAIAETDFRVSVIDPAVAALECESQSSDLPFSFLGLQDMDSIKIYLRSLMIEKREKFLVNFWIMDEKDPELERLALLADSLAFFRERVHARRNLLLINEYHTKRELVLPEGWSSLHNQAIVARLAKGEKKRPYQEMMLTILALVEWLWHAKNGAETFDTLFQNGCYRLHPDDFNGLVPALAPLANDRIVGLLEKESTATKTEASPNHRDPPASMELGEFTYEFVANEGEAPEVLPKRGPGVPEQPPLNQNATAAPPSVPADTGLLQPQEYAQAEYQEWADFRKTVRDKLADLDRDATSQLARSRSDWVLRHEGRLRALAGRLNFSRSEQIPPFIDAVDKEIDKIIAHLAEPVSTFDTESQWQTVREAFFSFRDFCREEKIPARTWGFTIGFLYLTGLLHFGPKIYAFLPLASSLLPHWSTRPLLETGYWLVFAFIPLLAGLGLYLYLESKYHQRMDTLAAAVDRLRDLKKAELTALRERQKQERKISHLRKVRILLSNSQRTLEEKTILQNNKVAYFKALAKSLQIVRETIPGKPVSSDEVKDVFAEYFMQGQNGCQITLSKGSKNQFNSRYILNHGSTENSAVLNFVRLDPTPTGTKG